VISGLLELDPHILILWNFVLVAPSCLLWYVFFLGVLSTYLVVI
jgi:hypothetical protein